MSSSVRCLMVWGAATTAAALLVAWLLPGPVGGGTTGPGGEISWLADSAALAATGCVGWLWVLVTLVVLDGLQGRPARDGIPAAVRRVVLAACGLSLAGALAAPAQADRSAPPPESPTDMQSLVVGLPLPDRTTTTTEWIGAVSSPDAPTEPSTSAPREEAVPDRVRVQPGDTLWSIARGSLPAGASASEVSRRWRAIYETNRSTVGADPDLIHPGQLLHLPTTGSLS